MSASSEDDLPSNHADSTSEAAASARTVTIVAHRIDSFELFSDARELIITHGDDTYRLRLTAQNKLILTK